MVMTMYGPFDDDSFTFPVCTPQELDDAAFVYEAYDFYYSNGPLVAKQSLSCSDQSSIETDLAGFPYYQTVKCITGVPEPFDEEYIEDDYYGENA